jgi:hypothetical protein
VVIRPLLAPRMLAVHALAVVATVAAVLLELWQYGAWQHGRHDKTASRIDARGLTPCSRPTHIGAHTRARSRLSAGEAATLAPARATSRATSWSLDTTTTGRPRGSAATRSRITSSAITPDWL